ncbi:MAG: hypothetical protein Q9216_001995 [Gyalolechia sp. 2 TL-2023]
MDDDNLFAVLMPCNENTKDAFRYPHNANRYYERIKAIPQEPVFESRESTPSPPDFQESSLDYTSLDRILLTFDQKPKDLSKGWQFGTNPSSSDVLLGDRRTKGISARHFTITIANNLRVMLHEDSTYGTAVGYDGEASDEVRKRNTWILCFEPGAEAPSRIWTPRQRPILVKEEYIGHGTYGNVFRVIDSQNGEFYAMKKFLPPSSIPQTSKKRKLDEDSWSAGVRNEIAMMKANCHKNVMRVITFQETPNPVLFMPYYPLGNLGNLRNVSEQQYVSAFRQILLGLDHLHKSGIAHRDLKPANVLVEAPFTIIIADFGFSKFAVDLLASCVGSRLYAAPEVFSESSEGYGLSVDIWSLGVMILKLIYGTPKQPSSSGVARRAWVWRWSKMLVETVNERDNEEDKVINILARMIRIDPAKRLTAYECLVQGCDSGIFKKRDDGDIVDVHDVEDLDNSSSQSADEGTSTPTPRSAWNKNISGPVAQGPVEKSSATKAKSWSMTIGPPDSASRSIDDSATDSLDTSEFGVITKKLMIKKDRFTASMASNDTNARLQKE